MGASRYMAVEPFTDEQLGRELKPGDFVTGSDYERMGDPEAFRPADFPSDVAALRDEYGLDDEQFDPAEHSVDDVNHYLATAGKAEYDRVMAAEQAGKDRKTIGVRSVEA